MNLKTKFKTMFITKILPTLLLTYGIFAQGSGLEEIDLIAYIRLTTMDWDGLEPGVYHLVYLTENDGITEPIALHNVTNDPITFIDDHPITLIYGIDETVSRLKSYGLEPVEGVRYRDIFDHEFDIGINFDLLNTLPMGNSKYLEKIRNWRTNSD